MIPAYHVNGAVNFSWHASRIKRTSGLAVGGELCATYPITAYQAYHSNIADIGCSKLDELAREIQSIKQSVGDRSVPPSTVSGFSQQQSTVTPFTASEALGATLAGPTTTGRSINTEAIVNPPSCQTILEQGSNIDPSLPRALNSQSFSGEDIDHYFQK